MSWTSQRARLSRLEKIRRNNHVIAPRILEDQSTIEWLPVSRLEIDMSYQRPLGPVKVNAISSKFNEVAAGVLAVNIRANGQIVVMDGQRSEEHTSELQSPDHLVSRLLL